jgi:DMSO reductase anchor subunit
MHPAYSVIIFTTFSGAGYGLAALLGLGLLDPASWASKVGFVLAFGLIIIGLISSTMHLGNKKNAIRAFSQWRTSWLSREGVASIISFIPLTILAFFSIFFETHIGWIGIIASILCLTTVFFTSMIYASLRSISLWNTWLTPASYLMFAIASGAILLTLLTAVFGGQSKNMVPLTIVALVASWIVKFLWNKRQSLGFNGSSLETATGLGHLGKVRLLEPPHMMGNYLTHEMGFRVARKHADSLWKMAVLFALIVPAVALALAFTLQGSASATLFVVLAALSHMVGMMVERWLFFANAKHAMSLYYGGDALRVG